MAIVSAESSRRTIQMKSLGYSFPVPVFTQPPGLNVGTGQKGFTDTGAILETGVLYAAPGGLGLSDYAQLTLRELSITGSTAITYGSGSPDDIAPFNVWAGKLFFSYRPLNIAEHNYAYIYVDYGTSVSGIAWTRVTGFPAGFTDAAVFFCAPVAKSGLTAAVGVLAEKNSGTGVVTARLVSGAGEATATLATFPDGLFAFDVQPELVIADTGASKNWFLSPLANQSAPYLYAVSASNVGVNASSDTLTFASSDVNTVLTTNSLNGRWLVTPNYFIWYCSRASVWDATLGNTPVNGLVIVRLAKNFATYDVQFLTWVPGDANASFNLDNVNTNLAIAYDSAGVLYYAGNGDFDVTQIPLIPGGSLFFKPVF